MDRWVIGTFEENNKFYIWAETLNVNVAMFIRDSYKNGWENMNVAKDIILCRLDDLKMQSVEFEYLK